MQPGITQPGVIQPGVTQLVGIPQPGVMTQRQVVQQGAPQLHNAPQHMTAGFRMSHSKFYTIQSQCSIILFYNIIGFPGVTGYNTAHPPGPPPPTNIYPVSHSFYPLSQPAGVSVQPHQCMPPGFQMFGKFNLHHLSF